jgi:transposase
MATRSSVFVGVDISKKSLEVATHNGNSRQNFSNDDRGIPQLVDLMLEIKPALVVIEATGGFE